MKRELCILGFVGTISASGTAHADVFHYNNLLQGDRAQGLGGAYTAISDDASGLIYNPAGLAFALSNDISGSVNAFYTRTTTYEKALGTTDFVEESNGSVAPFFGIMQKLDKYVPGLVGAFGNYFTDSDLKEQDNLIENKSIGTSEIRRFHRAVNARASTNYWSIAFGYRIAQNFSVGIGLSYFNVDELVQEYQDAKQSAVFETAGGDEVPGFRVLGQNIVTRLGVHGIEPVLGFQYVIGTDISLGLSIRQGFIASQKMQLDTESRISSFSEEQFDKFETTGSSANLGTSESVAREKSDNPLGSWPAQIRFGAAWFANTRWVMAFDMAHYTAVEDAGKIDAYGKALYNREAVTNYHFGTEFYVIPSFPLRFGVFTNNDARPEVSKSKAGQADHVDYIGESLFIAWVQPNSQMALGAVLQQGSGDAQKLGDFSIQEVTASSNTLAFSATHNF